jgi:hypothetical protein
MIDYTTKKYIFLEDFWIFCKNNVYDINEEFAEGYKRQGAKIIPLEECRELQINKILENE